AREATSGMKVGRNTQLLTGVPDRVPVRIHERGQSARSPRFDVDATVPTLDRALDLAADRAWLCEPGERRQWNVAVAHRDPVGEHVVVRPHRVELELGVFEAIEGAPGRV